MPTRRSKKMRLVGGCLAVFGACVLAAHMHKRSSRFTPRDLRCQSGI
jgi:hypothetical protein